MPDASKLLILVGSPRRAGNSALMAESVRTGAESAGASTTIQFLDDYISAFLHDCRLHRQPDGECSAPDNYRSLFFDDFLPAHGVVICSPVYWYALSAQTKAFFDRMFCYYAASYPGSADVIARMSGKRIALALASEETYPGACLGIVHQIQEYARYTRSEFVGWVRGIGNSRAEVARDPSSPLQQCESLGREFFSRKYSDYRLDTSRSGKVWGAA